MFRNLSIATLAALGLAAANPALASGKNADPAATAAKTPATDAKARYCVKNEPVTGSILQTRVCKTADEWRADGVDVTKVLSRR